MIFFREPEVTTPKSLHDEGRNLDEANMRLAKAVGTKLQEHYPDHPWVASSEIEHGIVKIFLQPFSHKQFTIHVSTLKNDPGLRKVVEAGGTLLEYFNIPRSPFRWHHLEAAQKNHDWLLHRNSRI